MSQVHVGLIVFLFIQGTLDTVSNSAVMAEDNVTVIVFSAYKVGLHAPHELLHPVDTDYLRPLAIQVFSDLLEDPMAHGIASAEVNKSGGPVWADHLHPTSKTHGILAQAIVPFLQSIPEAAAAQ